MTNQRHTISMLVEDHPGVLSRISGMFARRGFNIDTITVGKTMKDGFSRMVITTHGDDRTLEQVEKQINKLVDVIKVVELPERSSILKELCLIKLAVKNENSRQEILGYVDVYKAKVDDITSKTITLMLVGKPDKVESFIQLVSKFGIKEISRTGVTGIPRG